MAFHSVPNLLKRLASGLVWEMPATGDKPIYLTFDDGPVPGPTEFVLDTLARYQAQATFFAVGENVARYPHLAKRIMAEGHTLANHTQHHVKGWQTPLPAYLQEIDGCQHAIDRVASGQRRLFRPPYGRITPAQARAARQEGYQVIMWSVLSADYDPTLTPGNCLVKTYRLCRPGSIVVFHDSLKAQPRMEKVLPALLEVLAGEGYQFRAL